MIIPKLSDHCLKPGSKNENSDKDLMNSYKPQK